MALSDRDRKALWAKSANRCTICKIELFTKGEKQSSDFNLGEECHIISSKELGPRHKSGLTNYDVYHNMILLCRNHHREIDESVETYTEELLQYIKSTHENWVQSVLNKDLEAAKKNPPRLLRRISSGKELLTIVGGAYGFQIDHDEVTNKQDAEYVSGVLQAITDVGEIYSEVEVGDRIEMGFQLNVLLSDIEKNGFILYAERKIETVKYGEAKDKWPIATLLLKKF